MKAGKRQARRKTPPRRIDWRPWLRPAAALALFLSVTTALAAGVAWALDPANLPLRDVQVAGDFRHLDRAVLQARLTPFLDAGFFGIDVAAVQRSVQDMPWVDRVSVRRVWPDRLVVQVQEQRAVARWGESAYLNPRGEVFEPARPIAESGLPRLDGPAGRGRQVLAAYRRMSDILAGLRLGIDELRQDPRRAWHLRLSNGVAVELGRARPQQRLARFVAVYPALLVSGQAGITAVDLRYSNGFAVRRASPARDRQTG